MRNSALTDAAIAAIAGEQWAVITWAQLRAAGLSAAAISRRVRASRLHRLHSGVYALVPRAALAQEGRWLAAVFACGAGAALSHRSAARLWEILDGEGTLPEVTVPVGRAQSVRGVLVHRSRSLAHGVTTHLGTPVTTVERTLADLAEVVPRARLHRAAQQAEYLRARSGGAGDPWRHARGRHGAPALRSLAVAGNHRNDAQRARAQDARALPPRVAARAGVQP